MSHNLVFNEEFFAHLTRVDAQIAAQMALERCPACGGPLHQGNYSRKPRGALLALAGESYSVRHSLCCGWRGCRKRCLPPSLRFLGRRVYLEVVVLFASVLAHLLMPSQRASKATGVSTRTLRRWTAWWVGSFPLSPTWIELKARFAPPAPNEILMPISLVERLEYELTTALVGPVVASSEVALHAARLLAPETTKAAYNASGLLRVLAGSVDST